MKPDTTAVKLESVHSYQTRLRELQINTHPTGIEPHPYPTISQLVSSGSASRFLLCAASVSTLHTPVPVAVRHGARHLRGNGATERWSDEVIE